MNKVFTPTQMKEIESYTRFQRNISEVDLIKEAGIRSSEFFISEMKPKKSEHITVFSGPGNNGIDAIEMTLELKRKGFVPFLVLISHAQIASLEITKECLRVSNLEQLEELKSVMEETDIFVDGLFGTGLSRDVTGIYKEIIQRMNDSHKRIYSIDIPSGIDGFNGLERGSSIHADVTGIIGFYKTGNLLGDALDASKKRIIVEMEFLIPDDIIGMSYLEEEVIPIVPRPQKSYKYNYGNVLSIGGSPGMFGSIQLSAMAALRCGAGLSTIVFPKRDKSSFSLVYAELITKTYETIFGFEEIIRNYTGYLFGPGIKLGKNSSMYLQKVLDTLKPLVIDASGLDLISLHHEPIQHTVVLTPHFGELARMCHVSSADIMEDPIKYASLFSALGYIVVLKGPVTIMSYGSETILIRSGNPGMATAGMGDVLAGMILAYLQKKLPPFEAVKQAVLLHSMSGNLAREEKGEDSLIASDIFNQIPKILKRGLTNEIPGSSSKNTSNR